VTENITVMASPRGVPFAALSRLAAPTDPKHAKTRPGPGGVTLTYVDARYVMDMLDEVCGVGYWQNRYEALNDNLSSSGVRCGIGILVEFPDGHTEWVWKWDVGAESDIEDLKGAHSDALKRAAVQWGIARDLYDERSPARVASRSAAPRPALRSVVTASGASVAPAAPAAPGAVPAAWDGEVPWMCPTHGEVKVVLGTRWTGRQSKAGKDYSSFLGCTERSCSNTGPKVDENTAYSIHLGLQEGTAIIPGFTTLAAAPAGVADDELPF
jgi:hypothetical protein